MGSPSASRTQITLSWLASSDDGGCSVIDYAIDMGEQEIATGITGTSYTVTSLTTGTAYWFEVRARNVIGYSDLSVGLSIIAAELPDPPTSLVQESAS